MSDSTPLEADLAESDKPLSALALKIVAIDERFFALKNEVRLRGEALTKALELQAAEYSRRLEDLNHAHQKSREDNQTFVRREVYDKSEDQMRMWKEKMEREHVESNLTVQGKYVLKEAYEKSEADERTWRNAVDKALNEARGKDSGKAAMWAAAVSAFSLLIALASLYLRAHP